MLFLDLPYTIFVLPRFQMLAGPLFHHLFCSFYLIQFPTKESILWTRDFGTSHKSGFNRSPSSSATTTLAPTFNNGTSDSIVQ